MIVGDCFEGDNLDVAWRQHDVYKQALTVIVMRTNRFCRAARHVLRDERHPTWGAVVRADHRTLQTAHDILAAAWRWIDPWENPELPFDRTGHQTLEQAWLDWLKKEVDSWLDDPEIIRLLQIILSNQNEEVGYAAETKLGLVLIDRFPSVGWLPEQREALVQSSAKFANDILDQTNLSSQKALCIHNTYVLDALPSGTFK